MTSMFSSTSEHQDRFDLFEQVPSHPKASERCDSGLRYLLLCHTGILVPFLSPANIFTFNVSISNIKHCPYTNDFGGTSGPQVLFYSCLSIGWFKIDLVCFAEHHLYRPGRR